MDNNQNTQEEQNHVDENEQQDSFNNDEMQSSYTDHESSDDSGTSSRSKMLASIVIVGVLLVAGGIMIWTYFGDFISPQNAIAQVAGETIYQDDVDDRFEQAIKSLENQNTTLNEDQRAQLRQNIIDGMINEYLLQAYAEDNTVTVDDEQIDQQIQQLSEQLGEESVLREQLQNQGVTMDEFREQIRLQIIRQNAVDTSSLETDVTDAELQSQYDQISAQSQGSVPPLEDISDAVEQQVIQQKQQDLFSEFYDSLRDTYEVEMYEE